MRGSNLPAVLAVRARLAGDDQGRGLDSIDGLRAGDYISDDGGHGIFQLTASVPVDLVRPAGERDATRSPQFLRPAIASGTEAYGYTGDTLIRCVAAQYNAGLVRRASRSRRGRRRQVHYAYRRRARSATSCCSISSSCPQASSPAAQVVRGGRRARHAVRHDDRRKSAEARLARRARADLSKLAARRRRSRSKRSATRRASPSASSCARASRR